MPLRRRQRKGLRRNLAGSGTPAPPQPVQKVDGFNGIGVRLGSESVSGMNRNPCPSLEHYRISDLPSQAQDMASYPNHVKPEMGNFYSNRVKHEMGKRGALSPIIHKDYGGLGTVEGHPHWPQTNTCEKRSPDDLTRGSCCLPKSSQTRNG